MIQGAPAADPSTVRAAGLHRYARGTLRESNVQSLLKKLGLTLAIVLFQ